MSQETQQNDITKRKVVYSMPGDDAVTIRRDVEYRTGDAGVLTMDIYYPPDSKSKTQIPAVVFVTGYPDQGFQAMLGCKQKEMKSYISWAQLVAASGLAAITYTNKEPAKNIHTLFQFTREHAAAMGIDENRIGVWSCSGNVPNALSILMAHHDYLKCAVLCYGFMLDLDDLTGVADAAKQWGFVNPCAGKTVDDLPQDIPLFIARAGKDEMPHLNETIDRFLVNALRNNLPMTLANHRAGPHAFDVLHDSETSREIIRQILRFMQFNLADKPGAAAASRSALPHTSD